MFSQWNGMKRTPIKKKRSKPRPGRLKGEDMAALRLAAYDRDMGRCVACRVLVDPRLPPESEKSFHLAHRKNKRMWGDGINQVDTQCGKCHRLEHSYGKDRIKPCPPKA